MTWILIIVAVNWGVVKGITSTPGMTQRGCLNASSALARTGGFNTYCINSQDGAVQNVANGWLNDSPLDDQERKRVRENGG